MRKLIALMIVCLLMAALPGMAEEPTIHTFMGIPWDATRDEAINILTTKAGAGVHWSDSYYDSAYLDDGYYKLLGMQLRNDGLGLHFDKDSGRLSEVYCCSIEYPLRGNGATGEINPDDLTAGTEVIGQMLQRYGMPDIAFAELDTMYLVPEEELPFIFRDAVYLSKTCEGRYCFVCLTFGNVAFSIVIDKPRADNQQRGSYHIKIGYQPELFRPEQLSEHLQEPELLKTFPLLNGEIQFTILEP